MDSCHNCLRLMREIDAPVGVVRQASNDRGCMRYSLMRWMALIIQQQNILGGMPDLGRIWKIAMDCLAQPSGAHIPSHVGTDLNVATTCFSRLFRTHTVRLSDDAGPPLHTWITQIRNGIFGYAYVRHGSSHAITIGETCYRCRKIAVRNTQISGPQMVDLQEFVADANARPAWVMFYNATLNDEFLMAIQTDAIVTSVLRSQHLQFPPLQTPVTIWARDREKFRQKMSAGLAGWDQCEFRNWPIKEFCAMEQRGGVSTSMVAFMKLQLDDGVYPVTMKLGFVDTSLPSQHDPFYVESNIYEHVIWPAIRSQCLINAIVPIVTLQCPNFRNILNDALTQPGRPSFGSPPVCQPLTNRADIAHTIRTFFQTIPAAALASLNTDMATVMITEQNWSVPGLTATDALPTTLYHEMVHPLPGQGHHDHISIMIQMACAIQTMCEIGLVQNDLHGKNVLLSSFSSTFTARYFLDAELMDDKTMQFYYIDAKDGRFFCKVFDFDRAVKVPSQLDKSLFLHEFSIMSQTILQRLCPKYGSCPLFNNKTDWLTCLTVLRVSPTLKPIIDKMINPLMWQSVKFNGYTLNINPPHGPCEPTDSEVASPLAFLKDASLAPYRGVIKIFADGTTFPAVIPPATIQAMLPSFMVKVSSLGKPNQERFRNILEQLHFGRDLAPHSGFGCGVDERRRGDEEMSD